MFEKRPRLRVTLLLAGGAVFLANGISRIWPDESDPVERGDVFFAVLYFLGGTLWITTGIGELRKLRRKPDVDEVEQDSDQP